METDTPEMGEDENGAPSAESDGAPMAAVAVSHPPQASVQDILAADDLNEHSFVVEEWGLTVRVRGITRAEFRTIEKASEQNGEVDADLADVHLLVAGVVEPKLDVESATAILKQKSLGSCASVTQAIMEASGMGDAFQ